MHLLLEDGFDSLRNAYGHLKRGIHPAYWPAAQVLFLSWAYHAERINQMIGEYSRTGKITPLVDATQGDMLLRVIQDAEQYALKKVKAHGLDTGVRLAVPDDADLSVAPENQPRQKRAEFTAGGNQVGNQQGDK